MSYRTDELPRDRLHGLDALLLPGARDLREVDGVGSFLFLLRGVAVRPVMGALGGVSHLRRPLAAIQAGPLQTEARHLFGSCAADTSAVSADADGSDA